MDIQFDINGELALVEDLTTLLSNPLQARALRQMALKMDQEHNNAICEHHQEPPVIAIIVRGEKIGARVSGCCEEFVDLIQSQLKPVLAEAAAISSGFGLVSNLESENNLSGKILKFVLPRHDNTSIEFEINRIDRLTIGRLDTKTGKKPDIDLAAYNGQENGVSRFHATLIREYNALFIIDEGSPNGTWLNDQRLTPQQPYTLHDGDYLHFGRLGLLTFVVTQSLAGNNS